MISLAIVIIIAINLHKYLYWTLCFGNKWKSHLFYHVRLQIASWLLQLKIYSNKSPAQKWNCSKSVHFSFVSNWLTLNFKCISNCAFQTTCPHNDLHANSLKLMDSFNCINNRWKEKKWKKNQQKKTCVYLFNWRLSFQWEHRTLLTFAIHCERKIKTHSHRLM